MSTTFKCKRCGGVYHESVIGEPRTEPPTLCSRCEIQGKRELAQGYNALRGAQVQPGPDYRSFGQEVEQVLRDVEGYPGIIGNDPANVVRRIARSARKFGIPLEEEK